MIGIVLVVVVLLMVIAEAAPHTCQHNVIESSRGYENEKQIHFSGKPDRTFKSRTLLLDRSTAIC